MELPAGAFPDGDPEVVVEEAGDDGLLAGFVRAVVLVVVGLVALAVVLAQLRSEALGYVFVPAIIAGGIYLGRRAGPIAARERRITMATWQQRTGMTWIDPVTPAHHPARLLTPVGVRATMHGLVLEGRAWDGAPEGTRLADATFGSGRTADYVTLLEVPLPSRVEGRFDEVVLTFGSRIGDVLSSVELGFVRWPIVSFERSDRVAMVRVRAAREQDALQVWDLFDPALLVRLEAVASTADDANIGMVVRDGRLLAWCDGQFVEGGARAFHEHGLGRAAREQDETRALGPFLEIVALVHARLVG